ncbi:MAG: extracellular solute-binding protein [Rubrobacter sp.]
MRRTRRAVSRKDFLRLGGAGLAGAALLGTAGCGGSSEQGKVINMFVGTAETAALERESIRLVERFDEENPKYTVERESIPPDQVREVIQTRLRSEQPPDFFGYDTGPGFAGVLAEAGLLYPLDKAYKENGWKIYDWAKQRATRGPHRFRKCLRSPAQRRLQRLHGHGVRHQGRRQGGPPRGRPAPAVHDVNGYRERGGRSPVSLPGPAGVPARRTRSGLPSCPGHRLARHGRTQGS